VASGARGRFVRVQRDEVGVDVHLAGYELGDVVREGRLQVRFNHSHKFNPDFAEAKVPK